ncbi:hypothetical protein SUVZ_12G4200 [Saccharomyces uvarum]|uniref:Cytochrome c oxidase subunit 8, mitochondrial n=1 Tax=Saccharomyces uvarum TaxID=230603 RepID=A0ABN8WNY0_SACUV|nr:hypothetical protein SUVZ_12G4200 [Saccharomyces uvarum]
MLCQQMIRTTAKRSSNIMTRPIIMKRSVHFKDGVYENIPFKVKGRKTPYALSHFGFFAVGFAIPFVACYVQLKKSGSF